MQFTTIRPRKRRHVLNDTSVSITIHDVRREIMRQFEQLMPLKYCKSSEKVCPAGNLVHRALFPPKPGKSSLGTRLSCRPPGLPDPTGAKGPRGRRGPRGKKGSQGPMGPPGKSGKTGTRREKRAQGEPGPKGMPEPPGRPGKSISAQQIMLSPAEKTRDEGGNTAIFCTVGGNPSPSVEWRFKSRKLLSNAKYLIKEGEVIIKNLNYSDAGQYTCAARNILGSSEATGNLSVRGKTNINILLLSDDY